MKHTTILTAMALPLSSLAHAALTTYTPDANTTYLYHFDEAAGGSVASNAGTAGHSAISYDGAWAGDNTDQTTITSSLGASGFSGFGNAASITSRTGLGVDLDGNGGFRTNDGDPASPDRFPDHTGIIGSSFALDAMINVNSITSSHQEIIATDSFYTSAQGGNSSRGFQFRVNNAGQLEFNFVGTTPLAAVLAPIPTTGDHAFVANEWFHAAASFDGSTLSLYWTRVNAAITSANLIGSGADIIDLTDAGPLVIGNEARLSGASPAVGTVISNEGVVGLIDEVRISNVARGADEFIFVPEPSTSLLGALGLLGLFARRRAN